MTPSLEGQPRLKRHLLPMRKIDPAGHHPDILMSQGRTNGAVKHFKTFRTIPNEKPDLLVILCR